MSQSFNPPIGSDEKLSVSIVHEGHAIGVMNKLPRCKEPSESFKPCIRPVHIKPVKEKVPKFNVHTSNMYESLYLENECDIEEDDKDLKTKDFDKETKINCDLKKVMNVERERKYLYNIERKNLDLSQFENKNRFFVFTDNPEESIEKILKRKMILDISKQSLKKCKTCGYKKRNCLVDSSSCKATEQHCRKCKKKGHFPRSINCKARKKLWREDPIQRKSPECKKAFKMTDDLFFLVKKKINELENCINEDSPHEIRKESTNKLFHVASFKENMIRGKKIIKIAKKMC